MFSSLLTVEIHEKIARMSENLLHRAKKINKKDTALSASGSGACFKAEDKR